MEDFLAGPKPEAGLISSCFTQILDPSASPDLIAHFLTKLHETKLDRHPDVIAAAVLVLRDAALKWHIDSTHTRKDAHPVCVDIVGTGGDGHNTYNVSTTAAVVAAGVPGIRVIKHGNKASTSTSGSADVLKSYGCELLLQPQHIPSLTSPFTFLLASIWHPALARVAPVRKTLTHPTIFNILGPLLNPAPIDARIIGVHSPELGRVFAESFAKLNPHGRCMIVCGRERLDELSPAGETDCWIYTPESGIVQDIQTPEQFGLSRHPLSSVAGGSPADNATTLAEILDGKREAGDAILDYVLLNCAALLVIAGVTKDKRAAVGLARESIASGRAKQALDTFRDESTAAASL
ncbi:glycosyl transferase family, a/b domain-domain-containing protein [Protomyces lactucae-debilis]|uniref:Glycosyl transferase family, a/b domain-domain-containing protein n=1 Tax=Protomyces lactucae-debilis TaxID=2754530 RepID=A0A1Y2FMH9_PROLT|nr:glycosyl transferase family, a/b domain-containing protein [Protomyces lactucae-debilis]ORY84797.1 glycosyl transferase family, a/b domain-domain-containing protein [Protomyces lactucae-debilis]